MLNRINPLEFTVQRFNEGGEALLSKPSMEPMEDMSGMSDMPEVPDQMDDPLVALYDVLGEEKAAELQQAMEMHPVVQEVALMAIHTKDGLTSGLETGATDEVPARVEPGEFIFSKPAVDVIGIDVLESLHEEAKQHAASMM